MANRASNHRWLLGVACAAMIVSLTRIMSPTTIGNGVADFAVGLSAALMVDVDAIDGRLGAIPHE